MNREIISTFSGAGGFDLGFANAGFKTIWANEYDKGIHNTFEHNHRGVPLDKRDISLVQSNDIPSGFDGLIGGPPCQSWSVAGSGRGINDPRGQLFIEYIRVIRDRSPKWFVAENVPGILTKGNKEALNSILTAMKSLGYDVKYKVMNASDYSVPQDRKRVIFVGVDKSLGKTYEFPEPHKTKITLKDAIRDIDGLEVKSDGRDANANTIVPNHEYATGSFSSQFMSRNRVRSWSEQSFTIQASSRHAPIHPRSNKMVKQSRDRFEFSRFGNTPRRLTVRECMRIQTFPDNFEMKYSKVDYGYKMTGNAVPVKLAEAIANSILESLY